MKIKKVFLIQFFVAIFIFLLLHSNLFAQDIGLDVSVDRKTIELNSTAQLSLTVNGTQNASPVELPDIDGFRSRYLGPSSSVSIVNGQYSASISFQYTLFPLKTGTFEIPSLTMDIEGNQYSSKPFEIRVVEPGQSQALSQPAQPNIKMDLSDKVFLTLEANKDKVYLGEEVSLKMKLFSRGVSIRDIQFPQIAQTGFTFEDAAQPRQYQDIINGNQYYIVEFNVSAFPTRTGFLNLGPAQIACNLLYKSQSHGKSMFDDFGMFSKDFFGDFFGGYEKYPLALESKPFGIEVLALPPGAPNNFSLAVGQFSFTASVSPLEVNVGDPITIKMNASGDGNLKAVEMPSFVSSKEFKVYDPQIKEEAGAKILEQVLIPKTENIKEVPRIDFVYFNTNQEKYEMISRGPFHITVNKPADQGKIKIVESANLQPIITKDILGRDIVFIKDQPGKFYAISALDRHNDVLLVLVILYTIGLVIFFIFYQKYRRIKTDVAYAKRLKAPAKAQKGLRIALGLMDHGKDKEFYDEVYKLLQGYLSYKFSLPEGTATTQGIEFLLVEKKIDVKVLDQIKALLFDCDTIRYGAVSLGKEKMQASYKSLKEVIGALERVSS